MLVITLAIAGQFAIGNWGWTWMKWLCHESTAAGKRWWMRWVHRPRTTTIGLSRTSWFQFPTFLGESKGEGSLLVVFQERLLPRQHDWQSSGAEAPQRRSGRAAHDEPCVQVFSQTPDYPQINVNSGAPTTQNRDTTSNAFTTQSMFLPNIIRITIPYKLSIKL